MNTNHSSGYPKEEMIDNIANINTNPSSGYPQIEMVDNIDSFSRNCNNCRKKLPKHICQENRMYRLSSGNWLYWQLNPNFFSTFDDIFIIICTDNEPPMQWFLSKFENISTFIYLFWLNIKFSICIWMLGKIWLEVIHKKNMSRFHRLSADFVSKICFNNMNRTRKW